MGIQLERNPLDTTYFMEHIVRDGVRGCCHDFAYALHDMTGWKIGAVWQEKDDPLDNIPVHLFCLTPNGQGIDIEGARTIERLKQLYSDPSRKDRIYSIATYASKSEFMDVLKDKDYTAFHYEPRDHRISAARKIILASPKFLQLLSNLKTNLTVVAQAPKP